MKLRLDRRKIRKDVRMIELKIVQDRGPGRIVDELGALVEEGRVVLIRLDNESRTLPEPGADPEVEGQAADEEARGLSGAIQDPRQHGRGPRLAMGAGHGEHAADALMVIRYLARSSLY